MPDRAINFGASEVDTDFQMRQDGDDWLLEHLPSDATFEYDDSESAWIPTAPIGTSARPVPAVTTDNIDITNVGADADLGSGQTVPTDTFTKVQYTSSEFNDGGWDDANYKYVVPEDGVYFVHSSLRYENLSSGALGRIVLQVDGFDRGLTQVVYGASANQTVTIGRGINVNENQEIEIYAYHEEGSDITVGAFAPSNNVSIVRIG